MFEGFHPRLKMEGFTSVPNEFFDEVLANIDNLAELKILLATFRKTYGWVSHIGPNGQPVYKQSDKISYSQFGIATGLSAPSISSGIDRSIKDGYIVRLSSGSYGGRVDSAEYQIRIRGDGPPPEVKEDPPIDDGGPETEIEDDGLSTKGVETGRALLSDFGFSTPAPEEKPKGRKKREVSFLSKNRDDFNANDIIGYYKMMYDGMGLKVPFGMVTGKERANALRLVEAYGGKEVCRTIDWFFRQGNYRKLNYLPDAPPHFNIFYGYFKSIQADSLGATGGKVGREFDEDKHDGKSGVNTW